MDNADALLANRIADAVDAGDEDDASDALSLSNSNQRSPLPRVRPATLRVAALTFAPAPSVLSLPRPDVPPPALLAPT